MRNLPLYEDWENIQKRIGQLISVNGDTGQVLSWDDDRKVWLVRFEDGVRGIKTGDFDDIDDSPGGPFQRVYKQNSASTIAMQ